jgi:hypothetical protein
MFSDFINDSFSISFFGWIVIAVFLAFFFYGFNSFMCWFFGGVDSVRHPEGAKSESSAGERKIKVRLSRFINTFLEGGSIRWREFRDDRLSWLWPITVLALPVIFYGFSHLKVDSVLSDLNSAGINLSQYSFSNPGSWNRNIKYFVLVFSILVNIPTFLRYQFLRSEKIWFAKSSVHNLTQTLLFNIPLSYIICMLIFIWADFFIALYRLLGDDQVKYQLMHPDLMYGLKSVYDTTIVICLLLLVFSFLPLIIILREKGEKYNQQYRLGVYGGVIVVILLATAIIYQFDQRLDIIQGVGLAKILQNYPSLHIIGNTGNSADTWVGLQYYSIVMQLPAHFPIPAWLGYLISFRVVVLGFELIQLSKTGTDRKPVSEVILDLIKKLS